MIRRLLLMSGITLLAGTMLVDQQLLAMRGRGQQILGETIDQVGRGLGHEIDRQVELKRKEVEELKEILAKQVPEPKKKMTKAEQLKYEAEVKKLAADQELARIRLKAIAGQLGKLEDMWLDVGDSVKGLLTGALGAGSQQEKNKQEIKLKVVEKIAEGKAQEGVEKEKAKAALKQKKEDAKHDLEKLKQQALQFRKNLAAMVQIATDPQKRNAFLLLTGGLTTITVGLYYTIRFAARVAEDIYRVPALADKTTIVPWYTRMYRDFFKIKTFDVTLDDVVLTPELNGFFRGFVQSTKNTAKHGGYCRHLLLPGPPGTGKTLMSFAIANELGFPAIYFNAGKLSNCAVEDALVRIDQLFRYAENSPETIVIIIDESEVIFKDRNSPDLSEKTRLIMNDIMARTGTEQNNFILVALTNKPEFFDPAFKSRFSETIYINPPSYEQRKEMLEMYIDQYLIHPTFKPKTSWWKKAKKAKGSSIAIASDILSGHAIEELAHKLEGFSGRDISQLVLAFREEAYAQKNPALDRAARDKVVERKLEKKRREIAPHASLIAAPAA